MGRQSELKTWIVDYCDEWDESNRHQQRMRGYDREHVEMKFYDAEDAEGWRIISIKPAPRTR